MKKLFSLIIIFLTVTLLTGWDPFERPTGVWVCEELSITVDFDSYTGTIVIDDVAEDIIIFIESGGYANIYYSNELEDIIPLYEGKLEYDGLLGGNRDVGKGMRFHAHEWIEDERFGLEKVEKGEYLFIKPEGNKTAFKVLTEKLHFVISLFWSFTPIIPIAIIVTVYLIVKFFKKRKLNKND